MPGHQADTARRARTADRWADIAGSVSDRAPELADTPVGLAVARLALSLRMADRGHTAMQAMNRREPAWSSRQHWLAAPWVAAGTRALSLRAYPLAYPQVRLAPHPPGTLRLRYLCYLYCPAARQAGSVGRRRPGTASHPSAWQSRNAGRLFHPKRLHPLTAQSLRLAACWPLFRFVALSITERAPADTPDQRHTRHTQEYATQVIRAVIRLGSEREGSGAGATSSPISSHTAAAPRRGRECPPVAGATPGSSGCPRVPAAW